MINCPPVSFLGAFLSFLEVFLALGVSMGIGVIVCVAILETWDSLTTWWRHR